MADPQDQDRIMRLEQDMARLRRRVERLELEAGARASRDQAAPTVPSAAPAWIPPPTPPVPSAIPSAPPSAIPSAPASAIPSAPALAEPRSDGWTLVDPPSPLFRTPSVATAKWDRIVGANWLARAGVLVLALGVVFFLKLAFDNGWVPLAGRVALGVVGGSAMFAAGEALRRRGFDATYSQILAGGGALIAYATLYAAYALPHYRAALGMTAALDAALLGLVAATLGAYAAWRDLPVLAGVACGLSAILVAPAGDFTTVGLAFVALMGVAMLAAATWRGWGSILVTTVVAHDLALAAAASDAGIPWQATAACAVALNALAVAAAARSRGDLDLGRIAAGLAPAALVVVLGIALGTAGYVRPTAWPLLAVGLASLGAAVLLPRLAAPLGLVGAALTLLWPMAHFDGLPLPIAFGGLALAGLGLGQLPHRAAPWARRYATVACAAGALVLLPQGLSGDVPLQPAWQSGGVALALATIAAACWATTRDMKAPEALAAFATALAIAASWPFIQYPDSLAQAGALLAATAVAAAAAWAWRGRADWLAGAAAGLAAVGALSLMALATFDRIARTEPWSSGLLALGLGLAALAAWHPVRDRQAPGVAALTVAAGIAALWPRVQFPYEAWQAVANAAAACALAALATLVAGAGSRHVRVASVAVAGVGTLSLWALGGWGALDTQVVPTALAAGMLCAFGAATWMVLRRPSGTQTTALRLAALAIAVLAPVLATGYLLERWAIPVSWALVAFAVTAAGFALRAPELRWASLATFGLVLGRMFLVDLGQLSLPSRVLAFLITGAILLAGSFLYARSRRPPAEAPLGPLP